MSPRPLPEPPVLMSSSSASSPAATSGFRRLAALALLTALGLGSACSSTPAKPPQGPPPEYEKPRLAAWDAAPASDPVGEALDDEGGYEEDDEYDDDDDGAEDSAGATEAGAAPEGADSDAGGTPPEPDGGAGAEPDAG